MRARLQFVCSKRAENLERKEKVKIKVSKNSRWMQSPSIDKTFKYEEYKAGERNATVNGSHVAKQTDGNIYSRRRVFCRRDKVCTCSLGNATLAAWKIGEPGRGEVRSRRML